MISYGASQNTNALFWWLFFWQWTIWLAYHQQHYKMPPFPSRNHIFYNVLYKRVKPYYVFALHLHKCRWILDTYSYMAYNSYTIYMHNIGVNYVTYIYSIVTTFNPKVANWLPKFMVVCTVQWFTFGVTMVISTWCIMFKCLWWLT